MTNLLLIGNGKFGKNYVSTLANFPNISLTIANRNNWQELIDQKPDGVMVVTPPQSHIEIASYALERNIATMIEKPLALSVKEAETLKQYTAPILVNHIHLFSHKYQAIKQIINPKNIKYIITSGRSSHPPRDYSELWDYGPHEISLILDLSQRMPKTIECKMLFPRFFEISMEFDTFKSISLFGHTDNLEKIRDLYISDGNIVCNNMDNLPILDFPLTNVLKVFIGAIHGEKDYRLGLDLSLKVMEVLEKCQEICNIST